MKICVCGGGNLGHVVTGFLAARTPHDVCLLTRHPERWQPNLIINRPDNEPPLIATPTLISSQPSDVAAGADVVILCLPGFSIREVLLQIKPFLKADACVGSVVSSTGFFFEAMDVLPPSQPLFGLQRVPFIARTNEYGHEANIMGYKESLSIAVAQTTHREQLRQMAEQLFNTPTKLLDSIYEASLSNSNPLLHPARLYSLWRDWDGTSAYPRVPLFYEEWTEEAAQLYIDMDNELHALAARLGVKPGGIPTVLDYYESHDAVSLANKLRSIEAFKGIPAPMKPTKTGYVPDLQSRYFTEDFPYGLGIVWKLARQTETPSPVIEHIYDWGKTLFQHG